MKTPPRPTFRPALFELECRDVPAWWGVAAPDPAAGTPGSTAATHGGTLQFNSSVTADSAGTATVWADSAAEAATLALGGTLSVTIAGTTTDYVFGPDTVGATAADQRPFLVTVSGDAVTIAFEDMAGQPGCDYDYNDRGWNGVGVAPTGNPVIDGGAWTWEDAAHDTATVSLTVTAIDEDTLHWRYRLTNDTFTTHGQSPGLDHFGLLVDDATAVTNITTTLDGWTGSAGGSGVGWSADKLGQLSDTGGPNDMGGPYVSIGETAYFEFDTPVIPVTAASGSASGPGQFVGVLGQHPPGGTPQGPAKGPGEILIDTVTWKQTPGQTGGPIDAEPHGYGKRIYAERKKYTDTVIADKVTVRVQLTAPKAGVPVVIRLLDVDDPSSNAAPVDDEMTANDNRGGSSGSVVVTSNAQGVAEATFSVSHHAGDNYRGVASIEFMDLDSKVSGKANDGQLADAYLLDQFGSYLGAVPKQKDKTVETANQLLVWRHLHTERDHMSAPQATEVFGGAGSAGVVNEDDVNPGGPIPDLDISWMISQYRAAFIEVIDDVIAENVNKTITFAHNMNIQTAEQGALIIKDIKPAAEFFAVQMFGMYEPQESLDRDPDMEIWYCGWGKFSAIVFTEVVRDISANEPGAVSAATLLKRTALHESLHTWGMNHAPKGQPDPYTVAALNTNNNVYGGDQNNGLAPIHIHVIRNHG